MAEPGYTTDLQSVASADETTGWAEPTATGWTQGGAPVKDAENFIQGSASQSKAYNATGVGGMMFNKGSAQTIPALAAIFAWFYWASPKTLANEIDGGMRIIAGNALNAFKGWKVGGKDRYTYGGWINLCIDPTLIADYTAGTPSGDWQYFGVAYNNLDAITKGNPCLCDAINYGRELRVVGGEVDNYATFAGAAAVNDNAENRWGLLQAIDAGYLFKGLFVMGYEGIIDFRDSNRNIVIQNTKKVDPAFNGFEIRNVSSRVDWTNIVISALGTVSKGTFIVTDNADVNLDFCTFTDMNTFSFLSNSTILNTVFRRCGLVTQNSAVFTGCTFEATADSVRALLSNNLTVITNCNFISDGTKHAIELTTSTPSEVVLEGCVFTDYGANGTADAAIYNNSQKHIKINVVDGLVPTVKNGTDASTEFVTEQREYSFTVEDEAGEPVTGYEWRLYEADPTPGKYGEEIPGTGNEKESQSGRSYFYGYTEDIDIVLQVLHTDFVEFVLFDKLENKDKSVAVILRKETNV